MPDLPEPGFAQFEPDKSSVVTPTAPPATDIKPSDPNNKLAAGTYTCQGFSNIDDLTPVANLYKDTFAWGPYAPYKVGNGSGSSILSTLERKDAERVGARKHPPRQRRTEMISPVR